MSGVRRINPRRPFRLTAEGIKRFVLGDKAEGPSGGAAPAAARQGAKPLRSAEVPSSWHLFIGYAMRGDLDAPAREALAAAAILAGPETGVLALILGAFEGDAALLGADGVMIRSDFAEVYDPEGALACAREVVRTYNPRHIFLADKPDSDGDLGRRLIAADALQGACRVGELSPDHVAVRLPSGSGFASRALPRVMLLEPGAVSADLPYRGRGKRLTAPAGAQARGGIRDLGMIPLAAGDLDLTEADFIVSAGQGVADIALLERLADALGAAVGASRVAVDEGRLPRSRQIGATGKSVAASAYIAVGISGAVQHLQGIKDCRHVIAVNRDAGAPIVQRADLTIVGDAGEVMGALVELIGEARRAKNSEAA